MNSGMPLSQLPSIVLSVAPRWINLLLSGQKTIELRRRGPPDVYARSRILLYATKPVSAIVATCEADGIIRSSPNELWDSLGRESGCSEAEFFEYFSGLSLGSAIRIVNVKKIPAVHLQTLKTRCGWHPPVAWKKTGWELNELIGVQ
jgi:predicted transcriptional regulator